MSQPASVERAHEAGRKTGEVDKQDCNRSMNETTKVVHRNTKR